MRKALWPLIAAIVLIGYTTAALWPASRDVFNPPEPPRLLGDGTDMRAQLWQDAIIVDTLAHHPMRLLYGALYTEDRDFPPGKPLWTTMIERIVVPLITPVSTDATHSAWLVFALMMLNGAAAYWCARRCDLPRALALAAALAFAVNPYTRARASVHAALVGIFFVPLIIGAIRNVARITPWTRRHIRLIAISAIAFLTASLSAHYYLVITLALLPLWALLWVRLAWPSHLFLRAAAIAAACLPAILFVAWQYKNPVSPERRDAVQVYPAIDAEGEVDREMDRYGARPIDYVTGDIKLGNEDWLQARKRLGESLLGAGNLHERTNGIRWSILLICVLGLLYELLPYRKSVGVAPERSAGDALRSWALLAAFVALACSLAPSAIVVDGKPMGLGWVLHEIVPNARVPSRLGPFVHFALLIAALSFYWNALRSRGAVRWLVALVPLLFVVEYVPVSAQPTVPLLPLRSDLVRSDGRCGTGLFLPMGKYNYLAYERVRGLHCSLAFPDGAALDSMETIAGSDLRWSDPAAQARIVELARCAGLDWVVLEVQPDIRQSICDALGWRLADDACLRPALLPVHLKNPISSCLPSAPGQVPR